MSLASILVLGFVLGMRHATDADHVVAVSTIVSRERSFLAAAPVGIAWGLGHTVTILVMGGLIILCGVVITPRVGLGMELCVAAMLVLLGTINLRNIAREARKLADERARGDMDAHPHAHARSEEMLAPIDRRFRASAGYRLVRPLVIGVVHGLAGSAAAALLVLGTVREPGAAIAYLLVFGVGTIAGMLLITTVMAAPVVFSVDRFRWLHRLLGVSAGFLSISLGIYVGYEIAFTHGLFGADPHWVPR